MFAVIVGWHAPFVIVVPDNQCVLCGNPVAAPEAGGLPPCVQRFRPLESGEVHRQAHPQAHLRSRHHSNRMKIQSAVRNAKAFLTIQEEFGTFNAYSWRFVDGRPKLNRWKDMREIPATTPESDAFSKDLKMRGFTFVGSTVIYAHMQAVGMVNDHIVGCFRYREIQRLESPKC
jgi:Methyladenine glycosylase